MAFGMVKFEGIMAGFADELLVAIFVVSVFVDGGATFGADRSLHGVSPPLLRYGGGGGFSF